jgi:hypothetical protein
MGVNMADRKPSRVKNLSYAAVAGQAGCTTLIIIFIALFIGLWLDSQFGLRGPFTIGLLVLSVPISLFLMLRIALAMISRIQSQAREEKLAESSNVEEA